MTESVVGAIVAVMYEIPWIPIGSSIGTVGAFWQCGMAILGRLDAMDDFLGDWNRIVEGEQLEVSRGIPRWRLFKRRRALKQVGEDWQIVFNPIEKRHLRRYDQDATGWSLVIVAGLVLTVASWTEWLS